MSENTYNVIASLFEQLNMKIEEFHQGKITLEELINSYEVNHKDALTYFIGLSKKNHNK